MKRFTSSRGSITGGESRGISEEQKVAREFQPTTAEPCANLARESSVPSISSHLEPFSQNGKHRTSRLDETPTPVVRLGFAYHKTCPGSFPPWCQPYPAHSTAVRVSTRYDTPINLTPSTKIRSPGGEKTSGVGAAPGAMLVSGDGETRGGKVWRVYEKSCATPSSSSFSLPSSLELSDTTTYEP